MLHCTVFQFTLYCFLPYFRGLFKLALYRPNSNLAFLPTSPSLHSHPAATSSPLPGCGAASHSVNRWTLLLPTQPLFLVHIVYAYRSCFTDKYSFKATRLSLSRLIADKLASSSHLVSLDKHKLSQSPFHRLLLAVVLTNTGYKLIFLEIRENSSGQTKFKFVSVSLSKISLPNLFDQADREDFAAETALSRFRFILDFTALNPVVISDSALTGEEF